ncbi:MAG: aminotransferase class V-fold PLP-dependent enzyme [Candidatus Marinimicrobia bacterium]|nr:aminotransferase class V-fold PLP-dependent enzyme [Candidatus Neomarinimicrobiota bacterium]MBL7010321.1 aminotransferase class V-fold PLP-dependent enzyme [Candidatus Neomarinimicrobiota bacterium]MBL7030576.1 aminotransferase class V-fold PLP-dependent enzyme [Candidatus Neomarinimicrobiota bacterium]
MTDKKENQHRTDQSKRTFLKKISLGFSGLFYFLSIGKSNTIKSATSTLIPNNLSKMSWENIRSQFQLHKNLIYFNTGTEGSIPKHVFDRFVSDLKTFTAKPTEAAFLDENFNYYQEMNREKMARFVGASKDEIVLTSNTTMGLNTVLFGLDYEKDDEIITTLHDHIAESSPANILAKRRGIHLTELALPSPAKSKKQIIDLFKQAINHSQHKPKILLICNINYTTGLRMPVKELCLLARKHNMVSVVDGAHALGMFPLNLRRLGCDFYSTSGHKWLNGLPGTGVLFIRDGEKNSKNLWPVLSEFYDFRDEDGKLYDIATQMQLRGQNNTPAFSAMVAAAEYQNSIGKKKIEKRILELNDYLKKRIVETWGKKSLISPHTGRKELSSGLASFIPKYNKRFNLNFITSIPDVLADEFGIRIRYIEFFNTKSDERHNQKTYALRVSTHIFNNKDQINKLIDATNTILNRG